VVVNLNGLASSGGDAAGDMLSNIEIVKGSSLGDIITGGAADEQLYGNGGADTLVGGAGADLLDGGTGTDTADYSAASAAVTISLDGTAGSGAEAAGDTIVNIEQLIGSGFNDTLGGSTGDDTLWAGAGNDTVSGGAGNDNPFRRGRQRYPDRRRGQRYAGWWHRLRHRRLFRGALRRHRLS
jgi:Ca2+-binding RTX toxin-like protein